MSTRIWLSAKAETEIKRNDGGGCFLNDLQVGTENGRKYIFLHGDPNDPSTVIVPIERKFIRQVTYVEKYYTGFRTDGIYKLRGATAKVETIDRYCITYSPKDGRQERYQNISISAGSIKTLREIYSKVRSGELIPEKDWGISASDIAHREREAKKPAVEATNGETAKTEVH